MQEENLGHFVLFGVVWLLFGALGVAIARRKGLNMIGVVVGTFPGWAVWYLVWAASRTDRAILQRLERLEGAAPAEGTAGGALDRWRERG